MCNSSIYLFDLFLFLNLLIARNLQLYDIYDLICNQLFLSFKRFSFIKFY